MKGNRLHITVAALLLLTPTVSIQHTYAESIDAVEDTLNKKTAEKQQFQEEIEKLKEQMKQLDLAVENNQRDLENLQAEIDETKKSISEKQETIKNLQIKIEQRQEILKKRLAALQAQSKTSMITNVMLETKSFAELLDKLYSVNLIFESDTDILQQQQEDQELLEKEMKSVEAKEASLRSFEADLQAKQAQFEENQKQKQAVLQTLQQQFQQTLSEIMDAEEEKQLLQAQAAASQSQTQSPATASSSEVPQSDATPSQTNTSSLQSKASTTSNSSGFIKPAAGVYFSGFGSRSDGDHKGLDISASGTVPVIAAAAGKVIQSYYSPSYGNVVFISHSINGQVYTTVYAHLRTRAVSQGQTVSQGQHIGIMGNTGISEGQHLHFEIHAGEWNNAKSNAVDPRKYLP